jgi:hypothetical protein
MSTLLALLSWLQVRMGTVHRASFSIRKSGLYIWDPMKGLFPFCGSGLLFCDIDEPGDKPPVVRTSAPDYPYLVLVPRGWPFSYRLQLVGSVVIPSGDTI